MLSGYSQKDASLDFHLPFFHDFREIMTESYILYIFKLSMIKVYGSIS